MKVFFLSILFAILLFSSIYMQSANAQFRQLNTEGCEKTTYSTVLYRSVSLNIRHERAIAVDPEYVFPPNGQPIHALSPFPERNELGTEVVNQGFIINGTGTYQIRYAIEHASEKTRLMEIFVQSAGLPMVSEQIRYDGDICKIFELQVTEQPKIPTQEELVQVAYGIITPIIEEVEIAVKLNTDQTQRSSDRLSLITIGIVVAFIVMGIIWNTNRKKEKDITDQYGIMTTKLRNFQDHQVIEALELERITNANDTRLSKRLADFSVMFQVQIQSGINDLGHVIHYFKDYLQNYNIEIPTLPSEVVEKKIDFDNPENLLIWDYFTCRICGLDEENHEDLAVQDSDDFDVHEFDPFRDPSDPLYIPSDTELDIPDTEQSKLAFF